MGRISTLGIGLSLFVVATAATLVATGGTGQAGIERTLDVLGLLGQRSPGLRTEATLTKIKRARSASAGPGSDVLDARALGTEFAPGDAAAAIGQLGLATPEQLLAPGPSGGFVAPSAGRGQPGTALPSLLFVGGGSGGGRSGGSGGGTEPGVDPRTTDPAPEPSPEPSLHSAVPEPGTWATMLAGMALCGFALRRPRKPARRGARRPCAAA